jgi:hypothetical protein
MHLGFRKTETKAVNKAPSPVAGAAAIVVIPAGVSAALIQREPAIAPIKIRTAAPIAKIGNLNECFI